MGSNTCWGWPRAAVSPRSLPVSWQRPGGPMRPAGKRRGGSRTFVIRLAIVGAVSGAWWARPNIWPRGRIPVSSSPRSLRRTGRREPCTYCARGEMENRIKEQQLQLFADRTSTHAIGSNQLRLYFSSFAYVLIETLRALGLSGTELAQAQCGTIRLKLFKIGAQVRLSVRKIWIAFSEAYPYARLFQAVLDRLRQIPLTC